MSHDWRTDRANKTLKPYCHKLPVPDLTRWEEVKRYLWERDLDFATAVRNLWYPSTSAGDSVPRLVIPASSEQAGNLYWQARAIVDTAGKRYQSPANSRGDAVVLVHPINKGGADRTYSVLAEGPMDALAGAGAGFLSVALMGIYPPEESLLLTNKLLRGTMILVVQDTDQPEPMVKAMQFLTSIGAKCRLVSVAPFKDLADVTPSSRRREILTV